MALPVNAVLDTLASMNVKHVMVVMKYMTNIYIYIIIDEEIVKLRHYYSIINIIVFYVCLEMWEFLSF